MRRKNKGFTLAELLIVVAIIGVLVAISIPVFNSQLEKSRQSTDLSNLRGAYAAAKVAELSGEVAGYDENGYSVEPVKIGDPSTTDTGWKNQYSAIAYVFLYDSDSGALYPWSQENPTTCNQADDSSALVMTSTENGCPAVITALSNMDTSQRTGIILPVSPISFRAIPIPHGQI